MNAAEILTAVAGSDRTYGKYGSNLTMAIANTAPDTKDGDKALEAAYAAMNAIFAQDEGYDPDPDGDDAAGWSAIIRRWEANGDPTERVRALLLRAATAAENAA